jgi:prepilin-type processing-associated H-X9-DG protein
MGRFLKHVLFWAVGLLLLACLGLAFPLDAAIAMTFGWVKYLIRVVPQVTVSWGGVATAAICLAVFALGAHSFLRWLYEQVQQASAGRVYRIDAPWPRRWTAAMVALIVLMFVAGLAAAGFAHQVGWLLTSRESWINSGTTALYRAMSVNNIKQIGLALDNYHRVAETLPAGATSGEFGQLLQSWQTSLLPYLEHQDVYDQIDHGLPWDDLRNSPVFKKVFEVYLNPGVRTDRDEAGYALSHYAGNARVLGGLRPFRIEEIKDGSSETIMAGEVPGRFLPWGRPGNWRDPAKGVNKAADGFGGPFPGGANFLFADGTVKFLKDSIDPGVLKALGTPAGGERIGRDRY